MSMLKAFRLKGEGFRSGALILKYILVYTVKKSIENKVFANGTIDGYTVAAIDGTKIFGSYKKCCPDCLTTMIKGKKILSIVPCRIF
jgi:hypothetical protein